MNARFATLFKFRHLAWALVVSVASGAFGQSGPLYTYTANGNLLAVTVTNAAPTFLSLPQSEVIQSNSHATFTVLANGTGLTYQWLSNGIPIVGANGDSLLLANLPLTGTNLGNFSVIVSNASGSVTSSPAALWPDANGNGIPDWWEQQYFHNLNQTALGDFDGDGVDNLDEYLEGTNPTNRLSFNPRLTIKAARGYVSVSPNLQYYTLGQLVSLTANPDPGQGFVGWSGAATGTKSSISLFMNTNESLVANFGFPLGVALDNTNLVWTTTGNALWFGQAEMSQDGAGAAQSGPIVSYSLDPNQGPFVGDQTSLQTTFYIAQPEQLSFWWYVSSQPPDGVSFSINNTVVATLSGLSLSWQHMQTNLPAGVYTLNWTYSKGPVNIPNGIPFYDAAWVDQVTLTLATTTPPAPVLGIQSTGPNTLLLYWPVPSATFRLQQTATLSPANWTNITNAVNVANGMNQVFITPAGSNQFYRLVYP